MTISPELTTGLVAIGSALVGALPGFVSGLVNRKSEDKKQLRELVMKTTAENWRFIVERQASTIVMPFEHHMIHAAMMCELAFSDEPITEQRTVAHLEKVDAIMVALVKHASSVSKKKVGN